MMLMYSQYFFNKAFITGPACNKKLRIRFIFGFSCYFKLIFKPGYLRQVTGFARGVTVDQVDIRLELSLQDLDLLGLRIDLTLHRVKHISVRRRCIEQNLRAVSFSG